jgi:Ca2+-binding RTX toxin-like protein
MKGGAGVGAPACQEGRVRILGLGFAMLLVLSATSSSAHAAAERYPGHSPCDKTLQRCINKSAAGTKIRIATDKAIKENLLIRKSIKLVPARGHDPVIGSNGDEWGLNAESAGSRKVKVTLRRISFRNVEIVARFEEGSGHRLVLERSSVVNGNDNADGISIGTVRPATFAIRDNEFRTKSSPVDISLAATVGSVHGSVVNNAITTSDVPAGVMTNNSASGIDLEVAGTAPTEVDVYSNLVYGVAGCNCGGAAGIEIEGSAANGTVNLTGNTIDDAQSASSALEVDDDDPGHLELNVFDNIFSNASRDVVDLPSADPGLVINHGYNDVYDPGDPPDYDGYPAGIHTLAQDPLYVNAAGFDYHLQAGSPLKRQGLVCPPGGQSAVDLDGNDRVERAVGEGGFVTPGAYSFAGAPPTGVLLLGDDQGETLTGGNKDDVICAYGDDDTIDSRKGDDVVFGGDGADDITDGLGDDYLYGEAGQDTITAGAGADYLSGGDDFDVLEAHDGIEGNDVLDGGGGVDSCNPDPSDSFVNC